MTRSRLLAHSPGQLIDWKSIHKEMVSWSKDLLRADKIYALGPFLKFLGSPLLFAHDALEHHE